MKRALLTIYFLLLSVALFAQVSPQEKQALVDFYVATQGEEWVQTWDLNTPITEWNGVTIENDHVTGISLLFNNLQGELPDNFGDLKHLKVLELSFNQIKGTLPNSLSELKQLEVLAFNGNQLSGSLPSELGKLSNLKQLHLSSNQLTGSIPSSFGNLTRLEVFNVFDNQLEGALPSQLAYNRNLKEFMVAENNFDNTEIFSVILLSNSGSKLDLNNTLITPAGKSVIAIETSDDN